MSLSNEQKQTLIEQLADGATMADIQRTVNNDFGHKMTYMEVRFLIDDLEIEVPDNKPEPEVEDENAAAEPVENEAAQPGHVTVELDKIKRPGAAFSGDVVFSDGVKSVWYVDEMGRLGLDPSVEGYQPSEEDIQEFQVQLRSLLQGPQV